MSIIIAEIYSSDIIMPSSPYQLASCAELHTYATYLLNHLLQLHRLKELSEERKEQIETAEFQISTISQEYRKLIENRDAEIRNLKTENEKLREEAKGFSSPDPHSPLKELAELQLGVPGGVGESYESVDIGSGEEWVEHYHEDFSDVITSQAEINRLRIQLSKLKKEIQYWKNVAENKVRR